jgi:hypothetical protein
MATPAVRPPDGPVEMPRATGLRSWLGITRQRLLWEVKPSVAPLPPRRRRVVSQTPAWVRLMVRLGRPLVAVTVMVMCAPGEHHLAVLAGWNNRLAWGMAAVLAAYAGIAAAVAGERRAGDPGHWTAAVGAVVALLLAMAAQPVSHLFVTGWLTAEPRPPVWLVVVVSCAPPLVLGHLLHLAATPRAKLPDVAVPPQAHPVPDGLMDTAEVAQALGLKPTSVNTRVYRGSLVPVMKDPTLGNLFDPAHIDAILQGEKVKL